MLPDSLCSSCNNGYTSLDLHTLTQLCIGLLRYSKSNDFTLCPRQNTEHSNCDIDREKLRTISCTLQVARCRLRTYNLVEEPETQFLEPSVYSCQSMKRTNDYNKQFLLLLLLFYLWKKFFSHVHVTKADLKEKSFIFLFSSSTEDEPWKTFWVNGIIS